MNKKFVSYHLYKNKTKIYFVKYDMGFHFTRFKEGATELTKLEIYKLIHQNILQPKIDKFEKVS